MNKETKDISALQGEELFHYLTHDVNNEYSSLIALLPYVFTDRNKALSFLEEMVKNGKTIVAIYPGNGNIVPKGAKLLGSIPDGAMYIV